MTISLPKLKLDNILAFSIALLIAAGFDGWAGQLPEAGIDKSGAYVRNMGVSLSASNSGATLTYTDRQGSIRFTPSIMDGKGWTVPAHRLRIQKVVRKSHEVAVFVDYAVKDKRILSVVLRASSKSPGVSVTSKLINKGPTRTEYYFWSWNKPYGSYLAPFRDGVRRMQVNKRDWNWFAYHPWLAVPRSDGYLVLVSSGRFGHPPADGLPFIVGLPSSRNLSRDSGIAISFSICAAFSQSEAVKIANSMRIWHSNWLKPYSSADSPHSYGRPAPDWLRSAEIYNGYYRPEEQWDDKTVSGVLKNFPLIVGAPHSRDLIERCHKAGIRVLAYVNYMEILDTERQVKGGGSVYYEFASQALSRQLDLKNHPDWVCVDENGADRPSVWGRQNNHPGLFLTCLHSPGLQQTALKQVKALLDMGVDGVFIDNAGPVPECFGHKFGRHAHSRPDRTNTQLYEELQRKIYSLVKSFDKDRIVMHNSSGAWLPCHWEYSDAQMWESCLFGSGMKERNHQWAEVVSEGEMVRKAVKAGKVPVILSYLDGQGDKKSAAIRSYSYARLFDILWADWFTLRNDPACIEFADKLYCLRLGKPVESVRMVGDILIREFENGCIVLNTGFKDFSGTLKCGRRGSLQSVSDGRRLQVVKGGLKVSIPADSAIVFQSVSPER